jgi:ATP-dependent DNA ligase
MLAATAKPIATKKHHIPFKDLRFPFLGTIKIDAVRCITMPWPAGATQVCTPVTRALNRLPNNHSYELVASFCPPGLDGELEDLSAKGFNDSQSSIMRQEGTPNIRYNIFDYLKDGNFVDPRYVGRLLTPYRERLAQLRELKLPPFCRILEEVLIENLGQLEDYLQACKSLGHEGICIRPPWSPYKFGRSTPKEQFLIKIKYMEDAEAIIVGFEAKQENQNPTKLDNLGYNKRHHFRTGMVSVDTLGTLICRNLKTGKEVRLGSGLSAHECKKIWDNKDIYRGQVVTYQYQAVGMKDKARIATIKGFRSPNDIDPETALKVVEMQNEIQLGLL